MPVTRPLSTAIAFAVMVLPLRMTGAQVPPSDSARADTAAQKLKAVQVTETRAAAAVGGASVIVIKPENLRSSPAPLLEEALRESPFVHVRQNSRGEMELSVRGSG
jgi:outer membrane receptor for ferrienterochelin and colicin